MITHFLTVLYIHPTLTVISAHIFWSSWVRSTTALKNPQSMPWRVSSGWSKNCTGLPTDARSSRYLSPVVRKTLIAHWSILFVFWVPLTNRPVSSFAVISSPLRPKPQLDRRTPSPSVMLTGCPLQSERLNFIIEQLTAPSAFVAASLCRSYANSSWRSLVLLLWGWLRSPVEAVAAAGIGRDIARESGWHWKKAHPPKVSLSHWSAYSLLGFSGR